jgi:hypothetical protein
VRAICAVRADRLPEERADELPLGREPVMDTHLVTANPGRMASRESRTTGRAMARLDARTELGLAEIEAKAELQVGKVQAVSYVCKRAMHEVAMVSQLEQQLAIVVPMATARLQALGDMAALDMADVVGDTVRRVSR